MPGPSGKSSRSSPFEGKLVRLRAVEEVDIRPIHDMFNDPEVQRTLAVNWLQPVGGTRSWWEGASANPGTALFAIETLEGELIGVCSLEAVNPRSEEHTSELQ